MVIKMRTDFNGISYFPLQPYDIYCGSTTKSWAFGTLNGAWCCWRNMPYKFKCREDVEKLVDDMYIKEAAGEGLYDLDKMIKEFGIELYKEA